MRANRRRDTKPERQVRTLLHGLGLRFRVDLPIKPGPARAVRPDIVFTRVKLAVFIDGCFWHGCPVHGRRETIENAHYWRPKIAGNIERDARHRALLEDAGWVVLRFWEHDDPMDVARRVAGAYADRAR